jgi:hypothetical protein
MWNFTLSPLLRIYVAELYKKKRVVFYICLCIIFNIYCMYHIYYIFCNGRLCSYAYVRICEGQQRNKNLQRSGLSVPSIHHPDHRWRHLEIVMSPHICPWKLTVVTQRVAAMLLANLLYSVKTTYTGCTQKNGAVWKVNKKFISHLTRAQRTPSAAATVQVSHALITVLHCVHPGSHDTHPRGNQIHPRLGVAWPL